VFLAELGDKDPTGPPCCWPLNPAGPAWVFRRGLALALICSQGLGGRCCWALVGLRAAAQRLERISATARLVSLGPLAGLPGQPRDGSARTPKLDSSATYRSWPSSLLTGFSPKLGDKTQLTIVTISGTTSNPIAVFAAARGPWCSPACWVPTPGFPFHLFLRCPQLAASLGFLLSAPADHSSRNRRFVGVCFITPLSLGIAARPGFQGPCLLSF